MSVARSGKHSTMALSCLAWTTFSAMSAVRAETPETQMGFVVAAVLSFIGYFFLRPGGPELITKEVRQNQFDAGVLSRASQNLFLVMATSLAGPDQLQWAPVMEDVDHAVRDFPADVKKDIREAGKVIAAANWVVESFETQSSFSKWRNVAKDANMIAQATTCLKNTSNTLKVHGNVSSRILAAKVNGDMLNKNKVRV